MKGRRSPTAAELEILQVLWSRGPSTVRAVAEATAREDSYTTVLKLLQIMTEKRLVRRDESSRTHVYAAAAPRQQTQRQIVADMVERVFAGSAGQLALHALAAGTATPEELAEIRRLINAHKGGRK